MRLAAALLVAGCWHDPTPARPDPPPPPETSTTRPHRAPPPTCGTTIAHVYDVLASAHDASFDALEPKFRDALVGTCEDTQWSDDTRSCITAGSTEQDIHDCRDRMSKDQLDDLNRVLDGTP